MNSERAEQLDRAIRKAKIADAAAQEPSEGRYAFIQNNCGNDPQLMSEVLLLLQPFPARIGPYRPFRVIGFGGMGEVYAAHQEGRPKDFVVAVKVIRFGKESPEMLTRFEQERQNLFRINHPNVVEMKDCGFTEEGRPYFAMRYLDGAVEITEYCKERPQDEVLAIFSRLCEVLWAVHEQGVVHGDLKPSNILVVNGEPFLLDFGISELLAGEACSDELIRMTAFSEWYVAPEILNGAKATRQSDIRALGAVMHECLNGDPPFQRQVHESLKGMIQELDPQFPASRPKELRAIVERALRRDPNERYSGADRFRNDIENFLEGKALEPDTLKQSGLDSLRRWRRRNPSTFWLAATAATLVLALGIGGFVTAGREHKHLSDLQKEEQKTRAANEFRDALDALERGNLREAVIRGIRAAQADLGLPLESLLMRAYALLPRTLARFTLEGGVETIAFNAKSDVMVVTGKRGRVQLIRIPGFRPFYDENCSLAAPAAFRPDGEHIAIACGSSTIKILDARDAKLLLELHIEGEASRITYSPNGRLLAVCSGDQVLIFDIDSRRKIATIPHSAPVTSDQLTFSEDSRWLATASTKDNATVFDARTGKPVSVLPLPTGYDFSFAHPAILKFAKGNRLFVALNTGLDPARIWSITTNGHAQASTPVDGIVLPLSATISPAGFWLYAGMTHAGLAVNLDKPQNRSIIPNEGIEHILVAGKPGADLQVLTVQRDGTARVWRPLETIQTVDDYREYRTIAQQAPIVQAVIDPKGDFAATVDELGNLQVSDIHITTETTMPRPPIEGAGSPLYDMSGPWLSDGGGVIARQVKFPFTRSNVLDHHEAVQVIQSTDLSKVVTLPTDITYDLDVAFSPQEDRIAWTTSDEVRIASTKTGKKLLTIANLRTKAQGNRLRVRFTADGARLLVIRSSNLLDSELQLRNATTGDLVARRMIRGVLTSIEESRRRSEFAVGIDDSSSDGRVVFYSENALEELRRFEHLKYPPSLIRYSADDRYVGFALKSHPGEGLKVVDTFLQLSHLSPTNLEYVEVRDAASGKLLVNVNSRGGFLGIAFSNDGRSVRIVARYIGPVAVPSEEWTGSGIVDLSSGRKVQDFQASKIRYLLFAAVSRDGTRMAGLDRDSQESSVVNLSDGQMTSEVGERSKLDTPQFSDDGRVLLDVLADKRLRVRRLDTSGLIEAFCAASPGNPSPEEWRRWMGSIPYQKICSE